MWINWTLFTSHWINGGEVEYLWGIMQNWPLCQFSMYFKQDDLNKLWVRVIIFIDLFAQTTSRIQNASFFSFLFFLFYLARTGNWILERSSDGVTFEPWQYYAITETECLTRFNINPKTGPPSYARDDEVICTSFYSKIHPLENGEVTSTRALPFVALWSIAELGF